MLMTSIQNYQNNLTALSAISTQHAVSTWIFLNLTMILAKSPQKATGKWCHVPHPGYVIPLPPHLLLRLFRLAPLQPSWTLWLSQQTFSWPHLCLARNLYRTGLSRGSLNWIKANWIKLPESLCSKMNMSEKPQLGSLAPPCTFLTPTASLTFCKIPPPSLF